MTAAGQIKILSSIFHELNKSVRTQGEMLDWGGICLLIIWMLFSWISEEAGTNSEWQEKKNSFWILALL